MGPLADHPRIRYGILAALSVMGVLFFGACSEFEENEGERRVDGAHRLSKARDKEKRTMAAQIYGGDDVKPGTSLYVAALGLVYAEPPPFEGVCGGALIDKNWVLTAAHCSGINGVALGSSDYEEFDVGGKIVHLNLDDFMCHEDYLSATMEHDIALVKLPTESTITPIQLISNDAWELSSPPIIIAGWGTQSTILQEATVNVFDLGKCKKEYAHSPFSVTVDALCTRSPTAGALDGDSGGPVMIELNHIRYLVGIMSLGSKVKVKGFPNKHTKVTSYLDWIHKVMNGQTSLTKKC